MGERTRELFILIGGDLTVFFVSLWLTLLVRYLAFPDATLYATHFGPFLILSGVWLCIFYIGGLYDKHTMFLKSLLISRILNIQVANILIAAVLFIIVKFGITPKTNLIIYLVISVLLITTWRVYLYPYFSPKLRHKAILIADGHEAVELVDEINNNDRYNYMFVRLIDSTIVGTMPDFEKKILALIEKENVSIIIANPHGQQFEKLLPALFNLAFLDFKYTFLDFYKVYEDTFDRVPLSAVRYEWFLAHVSQSRSILYDVTKRFIDIVGSLILGVVLAIMLPFIYVAMRIEGKGPLFISQDRIGQFNKPVKVYKIRTMTKNFAGSSTWTSEDAKIGNVVTRVGAVLRKLSIDELPQIYTILRGEMSLIGPRNDIVGLGQRLEAEIPYYTMRNFVKPGVTGWAQTYQHYMGDNISPQSLEESRMRLAYDLYYVKNRSLLIDVAIALKTIKTVLSRFGITIRLPR